MSLVAYASSEEESDAEEAGGEEEEAAAPPDEAAQQPPARGLFATLPPPKAPVMPPLPPPHQPLGSGFPLLPPPHGGPPPPFLMGPPPGMRGFSTPPPAMSPGQAAAVSLPEPAASWERERGAAQAGGLLLPPPRNAATTTAASTLSLPPPVSASAALPGAGVDLSLPKPKKRTEPVRITAPELHKGDSDSEEDEPAKKKNTLQGRGEGSGLSALLPQPKNLTVKETNRLLLPYAFSRKAGENASDSKPAKAPTSSSKTKPLSKPAVPTTPSPSAIKAAAKSAALQVTKQITQEDDDSDEEVEPENYFSLSDRSEPSLVGAEAYMYSGTVVSEDPPPGTETEPQFQDAAANAPLEFKTGAGSSGAQHSWAPKPGEDYGSQTYSQFPAYSEAGMAGAYYQDYYSSGYYQEVEPAQAPPQEMSTDSSFIDDEAFKRLQGKRNRGREEINFVDIKGDDQLSGAQQWLTKSLTEEKTMKSFSKKKGDQPTGQQRRKHQITYLIHQAKERELELKNTWSENKLSRRQTQAKYGF
ncbi:LOW QUALITY PROTEIN: proline-rich protein PRCC [Falco biarmicus]|uniref:LOW QUALITY PROTEIN: proline-rich protein PRCC n=1 Tax=Falco biarmicus TaxID=345155 RepID=UPI0024BCB75D|nr:LOW QUALITY PROTEIN: proline-rich protein PRCC [Falco biarmicus]